MNLRKRNPGQGKADEEKLKKRKVVWKRKMEIAISTGWQHQKKFRWKLVL